ncbi:hypothetical protein DRN63_04795 [Nanoarchaeota archaeon]|nr:MAG: hypothetical protein DRN63_04795 [Nanoarchaeota archaeon]
MKFKSIKRSDKAYLTFLITLILGLAFISLVWWIQYYVEPNKSTLFFLFLAFSALIYDIIFKSPKKAGDYSKWKGWEWLNFFMLDFKKFMTIALAFLISVSFLLFVRLPLHLFIFNSLIFSCLGWYIGMCWTLNVVFRKLMSYKVRISIDILAIIIGLMLLIHLHFT